MRILTQVILWTLASMTLFLGSGCLSRQLVSFQTHPEQQTLLLETYDRTNYLVWQKTAHVYWSCSEADSKLQCERRCGGKSDLVCPAFAIFSNSATTNVR